MISKHGFALQDIKKGSVSLILNDFDKTADELNLVAYLRHFCLATLQGRHLEV
jgi:hypothetical protein